MPTTPENPDHFALRLRYRLITGPDDAKFCERVSALLDDGYELHGSPSLTHNGTHVVAAQALVLPPYEAVRSRTSYSASPVIGEDEASSPSLSADPDPTPAPRPATGADPAPAPEPPG